MNGELSQIEPALILVVEDDPDIAETLAEMLIERGYHAQIARHGAEALRLLHQGLRPALILLDLSMPVMDGWEFRREQLADSELAPIPVVVLTAGAGLSDGSDLSPAEWLLKPVGLSHLLDTVERHYRR